MKRLALLLLLTACGTPAEARPKRIFIRLAIVEGGAEWCDADAAWQIVMREKHRVIGRKVRLDLEHDVFVTNDAPALMTVAAFWDSSLYHHWCNSGRVPTGDFYRFIALPALEGKLYGGLMAHKCAIGNWEPGNPARNALILLHEVIGHGVGKCSDRCDPARRAPDPMCAEDASYLARHGDEIRFDQICAGRIRRALGLPAGKLITIGGK